MLTAENTDFGSAGFEPAFPWKIRVCNPGSTTVDVAAFKPSCGCTHVEPAGGRIAPGQTLELQLTLDLTPRSEEESALTERKFGVNITPQLKESASLPPLEVRGTVVNPYYVDTPVVDCGEVIPSELARSVQSYRRIVNIRATCRRIAVESSPSGIADVEIQPIAPGEFQLTTAPSRLAAEGTHQFFIRLLGKSESGASLPAGAVRGAMRILPEVECSPRRIHFGMLTEHASAQRELAIYSTSGEAIASSRVVACDSPQVRLEPAAPLEEGQAAYLVMFTGTQPPVSEGADEGTGKGQASARIEVTLASGAQHTVHLPIAWLVRRPTAGQVALQAHSQ